MTTRTYHFSANRTKAANASTKKVLKTLQFRKEHVLR